MTLKDIQKNLQNHKNQMANKYALPKGAAYDTMYSEAWTSNIMQGYPAVEKELQRIIGK
jgi:hypothetical protein